MEKAKARIVIIIFSN